MNSDTSRSNSNRAVTSLLSSRRTTLKAAAVTALAAATTGLGIGTAGAKGRPGAPGRSEAYDAIVIGAGFAGVTAARELCSKGLRTLVVEARDRIGGRTWTDVFAGERVEMGGAWVHQSQRLLWNEIEKRGIPFVADDTPLDRAVFPTVNGYRSFDPAHAFTRQDAVLKRVLEGAETYMPRPFEPWYREDLLADLDRLTLRDRLDQLRLSEEDEMWISGAMEVSGGSSTRGALTALARQYALSNWDLDTYNSLNTYRPVTGMGGLLSAMLADTPATVVLGSPVTSVVDDGAQVQVTTRGGAAYTAGTVVLAVPVNTWRRIRFSPRLPAEYVEASAETVAVPVVKKVWLHVRGVDDRVFAQGSPDAALSMVVPHAPYAGGQLMIGFSVNPSLDVSSKAQLQSALRQFFPRAELVSFKSQDWGKDPYSLGGWSFMRPLQLTRKLRAIQQPHGRIAFAGSDIATGWTGFIEGAMESGIAAGQKAAEMARTLTPVGG